MIFYTFLFIYLIFKNLIWSFGVFIIYRQLPICIQCIHCIGKLLHWVDALNAIKKNITKIAKKLQIPQSGKSTSNFLNLNNSKNCISQRNVT